MMNLLHNLTPVVNDTQQQQKQAFIISKQNWEFLCIFLCLETLKAENVRLKDDILLVISRNLTLQTLKDAGIQCFQFYTSCSLEMLLGSNPRT